MYDARGNWVPALLRARGGISLFEDVAIAKPDSSPRTRRYFRVLVLEEDWLCLFSAHAEVFPY